MGWRWQRALKGLQAVLRLGHEASRLVHDMGLSNGIGYLLSGAERKARIC